MDHDRNCTPAKRMRRGALTVLTAGLALIAVAAPAASGGAQVTKGDFAAFAAANDSEQGIGGHAQMVRTANGTTKVSIHVTGLEPGAVYDSHVHAAACGTNAGGGHYNFGFEVGGGVGPGNGEIWPGPVVANGGGVANGKATVDATAGESATSVVVHRSDGAKIACADLS